MIPHWRGAHVYSDASFFNGKAGIAYTGTLGTHEEVVDAASNTHAEMMALIMAMRAADTAGRPRVLFRADCRTTVYGDPRRGAKKLRPLREEIRRLLAEHPEWAVEHVGRRHNGPANRAARRALKLATGTRVQRRHVEEAHRKELAVNPP